MTFDQFYELLDKIGVEELNFSVKGIASINNSYLGSASKNNHLVYWFLLNTGEKNYFEYVSLDEMVKDPVFEGKSLKEVWNQVEIYTIDGIEEDEYDIVEVLSSNFKHMDDLGEILFFYKPSSWQLFIYILKLVIWAPFICTLLGISLAVFGGMYWSGMYLFGGISLITFIIGTIAAFRVNSNLEYIITSKKIIKVMGAGQFEVEYANIKKIKIKRSLYNRNNGSIKLYVNKGLSLNYHLEGLQNVDEVYQLIMNNTNV